MTQHHHQALHVVSAQEQSPHASFFRKMLFFSPERAFPCPESTEKNQFSTSLPQPCLSGKEAWTKND